VSGETPIYDATCRDVGPPPAEGRTSAEAGAEASAEASHPRTEAGDARRGTVARSRSAAESGDPYSPSPEDPTTADLSIPEGSLSGTRAENP
jgi:hypothetical protein